MKIQHSLKRFMGLVLVGLLAFVLAACQFLPGQGDETIEISFVTGTDQTIDALSIKSGQSIELPDIDPREGYEFVGWYTGESVNSSRVYNETQFFMTTAIYARWRESTTTSATRTTPIYQGMNFQSTPERVGRNRNQTFLNSSISSIIEIIPTEYVAFFANPGEDVLLTVNLYNPDKLVILRFTLNGQVYQSYEFQEGSNSEKLVLKVKASAESGIQSFTIDEIKYIDDSDNNTIKDVIIQGEKTIKLGVTHTVTPTATITNQSVMHDSIQLAIRTTNENNLINWSLSPMRIFLFENDQLIQHKPLVEGNQVVQFDDLMPNKAYQYVIAASFDKLDGNGPSIQTLSSATITTNAVIEFTNVNIGHNDISFNIDAIDQISFIIQGVYLYRNNQLVRSLTPQVMYQFLDLNSNSDYEIQVHYTFGTLNTNDVFTYAFKTETRQAPIVTINPGEITQTSYAFDVTLVDTDQVVTNIEHALYSGNNFIRIISSETAILENLLSNHTYTIKTSISYNLFDGSGIQVKIQNHEFITDTKQTPEVGLDFTVDSTQLSYQVVAVDLDQLMTIESVRIYQQSTLIAFHNGLSSGTFSTLKANTNYTIRLTYSYDLNDGAGIQTKQINQDFITAKITPNFNLNVIFTDSQSVQFEVIVSDINATGQIDAIRLYEGTTLVRNITNLGLRELTSLKSNQDYQLMVIYRYDLNDGLGSRVITKTVDFKTTKQLPSINVSLNSNQSAINYTSDIQDKDAAGTLIGVQLFKGAVLVETKETLTGVFNQLLSNMEYRLTISYQYDILDGQGTQVLVSNHIIRTGVMPTPEVTLLSETTDTSILYNFVTADTTGSLSISYAHLYKGTQLIQVGNLNDKQFNGLNSNSEYRIRFEYRYNLNDGFGDQIVVKDVSILTSPAVPKVNIVRTSISTSAVSFDLFVNDMNAVGQIDSIRLYIGEMIVSELTNLSNRSFSDLQPNTNYQIRVTYRYDLNDGKGSQSVVFKHDFTTTKRLPTMDFTVGTVTQNSVDYAVQIHDIDQAGTIHSIALSQGQVVATNTFNELSFLNLKSNNTYYITIEYRYDLNDGLGIRSIFVQKSFRTLAKAMPQGEITSTQSTVDTISFDYVITDIDQVGVLSAIELHLYGIKVQTLNNFNQKSFSELLSNTVYTVKLVYTYDLNDGLGNRTYIISKDVQTQSKQNPTITINQVIPTFHTINFNYQVTDTDQVGSLYAVRLYSGNEIVLEQSNFNVKTFEELYTNTQYTIKVIYEYDLNDGVGVRYLEVDYIVSTIAKAMPQIQTSLPSVTETAFTYDYVVTDTDQVGHLESVELWLGNQLIETRQDGIDRTFIALLSNNTYRLVLNYSYDLLDGQGVRIYEKIQYVTTLAKGTPSIYFDQLNYQHTAIDFVVMSTFVSQLVSLDTIELLKGGVVGQTLDLSNPSVSFNELLSNTNYQVKVYYQYNLNDGKGVQSGLFETFIRTKTYNSPAISFEKLDFSSSSISYQIQELDSYQLGSLIDVKLYQGETLVQTLNTLSGVFTNLAPDMTYYIEASYQYDLNDGVGVRNIVMDAETYTLPFLDLITTKVINTARLTEGDTIVLEIEVDNPSSIVFTRVMINGVYHDVSNVTTLKYIRVEFTLDSSYTGGVTPFVVERIEGYRGTDLRVFLTTVNNVGSAFINGDILVDSFEIVDEQGNPLDVVAYQQKYYIKIVFNNPSQYDIDYIRIEGHEGRTYTQFSIDDVNQVVLIEKISYSYQTTYSFSLQEFSYSDDTSSKQKNVSGFTDRVTAVIDLEPTLIYNANDLASIQNGKSYKLANDIYLTNITWVPKDVSYITLDGNGFTIYDLRIVRTDVDTYVSLGIFRSISESIVKNINISNALIMITLNNSTTNNSFNAEVGFLAAYVSSSVITNVTVDGEISLTNTTNGHLYIGGLIGYTNSSKISSVYSNVILVANSSNTSYVGGTIGLANATTINQVYTQGKVLGQYSYAGGVVGMHQGSHTSNAASSVNFEGNGDVGGILGYAYNSSLKFAYYSGVVSTQNRGQAGLILSGWSNEIHHSFNAGTYAYSTYFSADQSSASRTNVYNINDDYYGTPKSSIAEIMTNMESNWDLSVWEFSGTYPQIQWKPHIRVSNLIIGKTDVSFDIYTTNFNQSNTQTLVQIFEGTTLEKEMLVQKTARIDQLMYNTTYTIKVSYTYSYGSTNAQVVSHTFTIITLPAENTPSVDIDLGDVFDSSVNFDFTYEDTHEYGNLDSIYITDDQGNIIASEIDLNIRNFSDLTPNTAYQIHVKVIYDLGDGYGEQVIIFSESFRTTPTVTFTGLTMLNQSAIVTGDRLTLQLNMDNSNLVDFNQIKINGTWYSVASNNAQRLLVYVPITTNMGVGEKTFTIESVQGLYENRLHTFKLTANNTLDLVINGEFYVTSVELLSTNKLPMEYILQGVPYYIVVHLHNPSKYDITSVSFNVMNSGDRISTQLTLENNNTVILIPFTSTGSQREMITINNIQYNNSYIGNQSKNIYNQWTSLPIINNNQATLISTPDELQNMVPGGYYKLANDINLNGYNWTPIKNFYGVLDGNGYTISDLIYIKSTSDESLYAGLFESMNGGIIKNLTLKDFNFLLITSSQTNNYGVYAGLLSAVMNYSKIENVHVSGIIEVDNTTQGSNYIGLMAGVSNGVIVNHASVLGSITSSSYVGGMFGAASSNEINHVYANTNIISKRDYATNFIGHGSGNRVTNVFVTGTISHENVWYQSALIGGTSSTFFTNVVLDVKDKLGYAVQPMSYNDSSNKMTNAFTTYASYYDRFTSISSSQINTIIQSWDKSHWYVDSTNFALKDTPWIEILNVTPSIYGVSFELREVDNQNVGQISNIYIYQNGVLFSEIASLSTLQFTNLKYSTDYELVIEYAFDHNDGFGAQTSFVKRAFRTLDNENSPEISIDQVTVTTDSIVFQINEMDANNIGLIEKVELLEINGTVAFVTSPEELSFEGLLSNHYYVIRVTYVFDYNDGFGPTDIIKEKQAKTNAKTQPYINYMNVYPSYNTINVYVQETDPDQLGYVKHVHLYDNTGTLVQTISGNQEVLFVNLHSNKYYNVVVEYEYDLNDGVGLRITQSSQGTTTQLPTVPSVNLSKLDISETTITFRPSLYDPHTIGQITKVEFIENNVVKHTYTTLADYNIENLLPNTNYRIKVTFTYNLNDQTGNKTGLYTYDFTTAPALSVTSTSLLNQEAVMIGDYLVFNVTIDNPNNLLINEVEINGNRYAVSSQNMNSFKVNVLIDDTLGVGETTLTINKVFGTYNGIQYTYTVNQNNEVSKFINGDIRVIDFKLLNLDGTDFEYGIPYNTNYIVVIKLYNPTGYNVDQITLNENGERTYYASQFTVNEDKTEIQFQAYIRNTSHRTTALLRFSYSNSMIFNKTKNISGISESFGLVNDLNVREIRTVSDLQAMQNGYHYKLMNDIDLSGVNWQPKSFTGVLDGNHYMIQNLNITRSYSDITVYVGLFTSLSNAVVKNLTINNISLYITLTGNSSFTSYIGGLAGLISNYSTIQNVKVIGDLTMNNVTSGGAYSGLLAGQAEYSNIHQIEVEGIIESKGQVGGVIGYANYTTISNSLSKVQFNSTDSGYSGGLVGNLNRSYLNKSYAIGVMNKLNNSTYNSGIIAGRSYESSITDTFGQVNTMNGSSLQIVYENYGSQTGNYAITNDNKQSVLDNMKQVWDMSIWSFGRDWPFFKSEPIVTITGIETTTQGLSFTVDLNDPGEVTMIDKIELFRNNVLLETLDPSEAYVFEGLRYSTNYLVKVTYIFDYLDGNGPQTKVLEKEITTDDMPNVPVVTYKDVVITTNSVSFGLTIESTVEGSYLESIQLLDKNNVVIQTLTGSEYVFTGLYSNTEYTIVTNYIYDFNDGFGYNTLSAKQPIKTVAKVVPNGNVIINKETNSSIEFSYQLTDTNQTVKHIDFELFMDGVKLSTLSYEETLAFTNLYSNRNYEIRMVIAYNLNDQTADKQVVSTTPTRTIEKVTPTASFTNIVITTSSIAFTMNKTDVNNIGSLVNIQIFNGQTLVQTATTASVNFNNLLPFTLYNVVATYQYDKNDLNGVQTFQVSSWMHTNPEFSITSTTILNTGAIMVGDVMIIEIIIDNPQGIVIDEAIINGFNYSVDYISDTKIRVDVPVDEKFAGGDTNIVIEQLMGTKNNVRFYISPSTNNTVNTFINGTIYVTNVRLLDENGNELYFNQQYQSYIVEVEFYNPTGYNINRIDMGNRSNNDIKVYSSAMSYNENNTVVRFEQVTPYYDSSWAVYDYINITKFNYSNDRIASRDRVVSFGAVYHSVLANESITMISTAAELQAMVSGYHYQLANDIDLLGVEWNPINNFKGVFDGNGHTISNLSIVRTYEDESLSLGLFGDVTFSTIRNLNIENFNIIGTLRAFSSNTYSVYIGALAGQLGQSSYVSNITYNGNITFNNTTNGDSRLGGLFGTINSYNQFLNINGNATIESKSPNNYLGGFAGYIGSYNTFNDFNITSLVKGQSNNGGFSGYMEYQNTIENATINTVVTGNNYQGGLVGNLGGNNIIKKVDVNASIIGNQYVGGMIGYSSRSEITQSTFVGEISGAHMVGGLIGYGNDMSIDNSYANVDFQSSNNNYEGGLIGFGERNIITSSFAIGTTKSNNSRGITNYGDQAMIVNVYSYILFNGSSFLPSLYSQTMNTTNVYSPVNSPNAQTKSIGDIISIMSTLFDSTIWDFENPIDEVGHPSLR